MDASPTADDLARVPLLRDQPRDTLAALAVRFGVEEFAAGRNVVTEGHAGYAFYIVASGKATVSHDGDELRMLGSGDFFGEIAILDQGRRTATVTAVEPVVVWVLFGTDFRSLQTDRPDVAAALEVAMRERLADG